MSNDFPWYLTSDYRDEHGGFARNEPWKPAWTAQDLEVHLKKHDMSVSELSFGDSRAALAACLIEYCAMD